MPGHPGFPIFGANSGFDSIEECFGEMSSHIHAIETGLSSDPEMNWRLSALDGDHPHLQFRCPLTQSAGKGGQCLRLRPGLSRRSLRRFEKRTGRKFLFTIEFFPEEGKIPLRWPSPMRGDLLSLSNQGAPVPLSGLPEEADRRSDASRRRTR